MKESFDIVISNGQARAIYTDALVAIMEDGEAVTVRASHVEPESGGWVADMAPSQGPKLGPFTTRTEALQAEVKWLQQIKGL